MTPHFLPSVINDSFVRVATCACARQPEHFHIQKREAPPAVGVASPHGCGFYSLDWSHWSGLRQR